MSHDTLIVVVPSSSAVSVLYIVKLPRLHKMANLSIFVFSMQFVRFKRPIFTGPSYGQIFHLNESSFASRPHLLLVCFKLYCCSPARSHFDAFSSPTSRECACAVDAGGLRTTDTFCNNKNMRSRRRRRLHSWTCGKGRRTRKNIRFGVAPSSSTRRFHWIITEISHQSVSSRNLLTPPRPDLAAVMFTAPLNTPSTAPATTQILASVPPIGNLSITREIQTLLKIYIRSYCAG